MTINLLMLLATVILAYCAYRSWKCSENLAQNANMTWDLQRKLCEAKVVIVPRIRITTPYTRYKKQMLDVLIDFRIENEGSEDAILLRVDYIAIDIKSGSYLHKPSSSTEVRLEGKHKIFTESISALHVPVDISSRKINPIAFIVLVEYRGSDYSKQVRIKKRQYKYEGKHTNISTLSDEDFKKLKRIVGTESKSLFATTIVEEWEE